MHDLTVQILSSEDDVNNFDCGSEEWESNVSDFLKENALVEQVKGMNKTHLFKKDGVCVGYVSLLAANIRADAYDNVPEVGRAYAPCILVGQLGVASVVSRN